MLPRGLRRAAWLSLVLSGAVGFWAVSETLMMFRLDELRDGFSPSKMILPPGVDADPKLEQQLEASQEKQFNAMVAALSSMREGRVLTLGALAMACALSFVSAWRILHPAGLPREGVRRLLGVAAVAAGLLRVVDGAEWAVVKEREGLTLARALEGISGASDLATALQRFAGWMPAFGLAQAILPTALVAGCFVAVGQYFRSERVRKIVAFRDTDAGSA